MIVDLDDDGAITEEDKVELLRLMPVPTLPLDIVQEYAMSTTDHLGKHLVVHECMMQERAEFAVEEYFLKIFRKDLEEAVELSLVTWLLLAQLILLDNKLITATLNQALMSAASIPDIQAKVLRVVCERLTPVAVVAAVAKEEEAGHMILAEVKEVVETRSATMM